MTHAHICMCVWPPSLKVTDSPVLRACAATSCTNAPCAHPVAVLASCRQPGMTSQKRCSRGSAQLCSASDGVARGCSTMPPHTPDAGVGTDRCVPRLHRWAAAAAGRLQPQPHPVAQLLLACAEAARGRGEPSQAALRQVRQAKVSSVSSQVLGKRHHTLQSLRVGGRQRPCVSVGGTVSGKFLGSFWEEIL